jgi:hypothetical protein
MPFAKTARLPEHYFAGGMRTMPPQTAVILWIPIILARFVRTPNRTRGGLF